jgi:hypothetical protein
VTATAHISVRVADTKIRHLGPITAGRSSWALSGDDDTVQVYFQGSDDDILAHADRCYAAVTQHRAQVGHQPSLDAS